MVIKLSFYKPLLLVILEILCINNICVTSTILRHLLSPPDDYNGWVYGSGSLPRQSDGMAVGYDADSNKIWLLGGNVQKAQNQTQLISFQIKNNAFVDHGLYYFNKNIDSGINDYYTQLNDYLYMISGGTSIQRFNVKTMVFDIVSTTIPKATCCACLTSLDVNGGYLFVFGQSKVMQIYDISRNLWLLSVPAMNSDRHGYSTCVVHKDTSQLYMIGSHNVEVLNISDLANILIEPWQSFGSIGGSYGIVWMRSIIYGNDILTIGGAWYHDSEYWKYITDIYVIDTLTNTLTINGNTNRGLSSVSAIVVNSRAYMFGGSNNAYTEDGTLYVNSWSLLDFTLLNPTSKDYCESIKKDGTLYGLIYECKGDVDMTPGKLIATIPMANHFKIEFTVSITRLKDGWTDILCIGSAECTWDNSFPNIGVHYRTEAEFEIFMTSHSTNGKDVSQSTCDSRNFSLPATAVKFSLEISQTINKFNVFVNGYLCTEISGDKLNYAIIGTKGVYIPSTGGLSSDGQISDLVITIYDRTRPQCVHKTNYDFEGNPASRGPLFGHFRMWNGDYHDFQGPDVNEQFYYITRSESKTINDLPFNILGKHNSWNDGSLRVLEYIVIELFDIASNNDYYLIFLSHDILKYTANPVTYGTASTFYSDSYQGLSTFRIGWPVYLGNLFMANVSNVSSTTINFTLEIESCSISILMTDYKSWIKLIVLQPTCFKCSISGLLGDFIQGPITGRPAKIASCKGNPKYIDIKAGLDDDSDAMVKNTAYDKHGLSWSKSNCSRGPSRRRRLGSTSEYILSAPDDFVFVDECPDGSDIAIATVNACQTVRDEYDTLCTEIEEICNSLQLNCNYDACVVSNGNETALSGIAEDLFGSILGLFETIPNIADLYDPLNTVAITNEPTNE
eukprot:146805_1